MIKTVLTVAGVGIAAEALRRALAARTANIPAQVSEAAAGEIRGKADDYAALYRQERDALIAKVGSTTGASCSERGLGTCFQNPAIAIPRPDLEALNEILGRWAGIAARVSRDSGTPGASPLGLWDLSLAADLAGYNVALTSMRAQLAFGLTDDLNRRAWAALARLSIALQGVLVNHGDARKEAAKELADTMTDPASYFNAAADLLGFVVGLASTNLGAIVLVGGAGYLVWKGSR